MGKNRCLRRAPDERWERAYRTSGMPAFLKLLSDLATQEEPKLKAAWPKKRAAALRRLFDEVATKSSAEPRWASRRA